MRHFIKPHPLGRNMLNKKCVICGKEFEKDKRISMRIWETQTRFCSQKCVSKDKQILVNRKKGIVESFKEGRKAWNKGIPSPKGELNPSWKGEKAGYAAKHKWIVTVLGNPETCKYCDKTGLKRQQIHWANKNHKYRRNIKDWMRLCRECHLIYDRKFK